MSLHSAVSPTAILQRMAAQKGVKLGWVDDARRTATPWLVDCLDLHDETLLDPVIARMFWERRKWCVDHCRQGYEIEPLTEGSRLLGRRFRFTDPKYAVLFKLKFC